MKDDRNFSTGRMDSPANPESPEHDRKLLDKSTDVENRNLPELSAQHSNYLLERHGTTELDPIPSADPSDPYNWQSWQKTITITLVSFHAMMSTFTAAGIIPAFELISKDLGVSLTKASYLTSMQIAILAVSPLFWKPLSLRYGRRPVWLVSTILSGVTNVGCAVSHSYGAMAVCRCLVSFFISPAIAIGGGVVVELFFARERGQKMGIWTLMVTLGPPMGPFLMGFVAKNIGYRWIYWIFAIINAAQFVTYLFLVPESRYIRDFAYGPAPVARSSNPTSTGRWTSFKRNYLHFGRIDKKPFRISEVTSIFLLARRSSILVSTISYSIVFGFASVFLTVEIPQIFIPKWHLDPQQLGLQFLGMIIGSVIGEQLAGPLSDIWMRRAKRVQKEDGSTIKQPEFRLWLSYFGFLLVIGGLLLFGLETYYSGAKWNVKPVVGIGIAAAGNQIITTVLVTYAIDCYKEDADAIGVFINLIRSLWGFIGPFWFPDMIENVGVAGSSGIMCGIVLIFSILPIMAIQFWKSRRV